MLILKIFKIKRIIREAKENPSALAGDETADLVQDIFIIPIISLVVSSIITYLLGYTDVIFNLGPFGFFKFLFWILILITIFVFILFKTIRKAVKNITERTIKISIDK